MRCEWAFAPFASLSNHFIGRCHRKWGRLIPDIAFDNDTDAKMVPTASKSLNLSSKYMSKSRCNFSTTRFHDRGLVDWYDSSPIDDNPPASSATLQIQGPGSTSHAWAPTRASRVSS